jgi:hypothetical protein
MSPNKIPTEIRNYVKTEKRDAKKIAFSLSKNFITEIYIPSIERSDFRNIFGLKSKVIKARVQAVNRIKILLVKQ